MIYSISCFVQSCMHVGMGCCLVYGNYECKSSVYFILTCYRPENVYGIVEIPLKIAQTLAILEIFHSLFRLVRSPVVSCIMQVASRIALLWGICNISPESRQCYGFLLMIISWSTVEVPRYLYYIFGLLNIPCPTILLFLRYHMFMVLYPTGITGEIWCLLKALPRIKSSQIYSIALPNDWNFVFNYYYVMIIALLAYIPGSPFMYNTMLITRNKHWNADKKKD